MDFDLSPHEWTKHMTRISRRYNKSEKVFCSAFYFTVFSTLLSSQTSNKIKTKQCIYTFLTVKVQKNDSLYESLTISEEHALHTAECIYLYI